MAWQAVITDTGLNMLSQLTTSTTLELTSVGTATGTTESMSTATSLTDPVTLGASEWGLTFVSESDGVRIRCRIYAHEEQYIMRQIGVFASFNGGSPALFALLQYLPEEGVTGVTIPSTEVFPDFAFNISFFVETSRTSSFSVTVNTSSLVSQSQLNTAMAHVVNLYRQYYALQTSISLTMEENKNYFLWSSSSGISLLDADYGSLFFISNKKVAILHRGSKISYTQAAGVFTVSTTDASSVPMAIVEI